MDGKGMQASMDSITDLSNGQPLSSAVRASALGWCATKNIQLRAMIKIGPTSVHEEVRHRPPLEGTAGNPARDRAGILQKVEVSYEKKEG